MKIGQKKLTEPLWITIGNFDGLHLGHQALLSRLRTLAQAQETQSGMLTFWPHPRVFFQGLNGPFLLDHQSGKIAQTFWVGLSYHP